MRSVSRPGGEHVYVRIGSPPGGAVDAQEVEGTIKTARSDYAGRCYLFTTGCAWIPTHGRVAEEGGVQLVDGQELAELA